MRHLFGYPVTLELQVAPGTLLDVSAALKINNNNATGVEVDIEKVLDLIQEWELRHG